MKKQTIKTTKKKPQRRKELGLNQNSPHNNGSLHNHLPRKIRNIIPETPTQNVPTLPQNSAPLIRQHRRHSSNKNQNQKYNREHQIKNQTRHLRIEKIYLRI